MNVPIGLLGFVLVSKYIENSRVDEVAPLDLRGFVLLSLSLALLVFGV